MRRIALVRKRDGATVPFDQERVRDAIERALLAAGREERALAGEIASVVELFLEKTFFDEIPETEQIEDMVEKVLMDTGHAAAAKAFILHRERRRRLRDARHAREARFQPTLFDDRVVIVDDAAAGSSAAFSRERLSRTLASDGAVPRRVADDVAAGVEQHLRRAGAGRVPASLVRALAEVALLDHDVTLDLRRRGGAVLAADHLAAALYRKGTGGPSAPGGAPFPAVAATELGGAALRAHALAELLPADVARAHLDGDLHVHGLHLPVAFHSAVLRPSDVADGSAPGGAARAPGDAARSARRLSAALGRSARFLGAAVTDGVTVADVPAAYAPLLVESSADAISEEAWHLLHELSADVGGRRVTLDLTPAPRSLGEEVPDRVADCAAAFAAAVLRTHGRREGLPGPDLLPEISITVNEDALGSGEGRDVLRLAAEAVLRGSSIVFPLDRGPSSDSGRGRRQAVARPAACAGRVTLNLPRLARRVGRGRIEGFLRACDQLIDVAAAGHLARRELMAQVAGASGGSLAPLLRGRRGRPALYDVATAGWSFGVTGLNEAVQILSGFELHDADGDIGSGGLGFGDVRSGDVRSGDWGVRRLARRIVSYLAVRARAAGAADDFVATLDAEESLDVARRLFRADRLDAPDAMAQLFPDREAYSPGIGLRPDAPLDLLARVEHEEPLHQHLGGATLRVRMPTKEAGGPDGVIALLRKFLRAGAAVRVEVSTW